MHPEVAFVALFSVASAVALVTRRLKIPYTVALVVAGLALGSARVLSPPHLTKELLYAVFLPGLVFEAAFALSFEHFWKNKLAIFALAVPGVVVAIGLTTAILVPVANGLHFVSGFTVGVGLVFAAAIAATDPIAVVALFKSLGAPKRLGTLIEGESLLNDGTAIVLFTIVLDTVVFGHARTWSQATVDFARIVGMGAVVGAVIGYAASVLIHKVDDAMIEITLTTIAAYGSFVAAEQFHFSGVIATVTAGMLCGNYAAQTGMSPSTRIAVGVFWEYLAFALNSAVFLLIGFEVEISSLIAAWKPIVAAFAAVVVGRAIVIQLVGLLLRRTRERLPSRWTAVLTWGGLRGGLSMVLVLGLPSAMPHRDLVVTMTFGVVILSILAQGLSMGPLLRRLGVIGAEPTRAALETLRARLMIARAAAREVERMRAETARAPRVLEELEAQCREELARAEASLAEATADAASLREEERRAAHRRALVAQRATLLEALRSGEVGEEVHDHLRSQIDQALAALDAD
jgi:CPA1 family monovalent cation:H+ antiporter